MAGRGPAPKPEDKRARTNADPVPKTILPFRRSEPPALPDDIDWHPRTREWWAMWAASPQAVGFTDTDWSFLLDTALMHHAMWGKQQWTLAAEVRLRVSKFGATPEDRARLRMVFSDPDEKPSGEQPTERPKSGSRQRYGNLRAVAPPSA